MRGAIFPSRPLPVEYATIGELFWVFHCEKYMLSRGSGTNLAPDEKKPD
jgi:hypothetical protein